MNNILLPVLMVTFCISNAFALTNDAKEQVMVTNEEYKAIIAKSPWVELQHMKDLPAPIQALIMSKSGKMAEPDEEWEATDDIGDVNLPRSKFIWAAVYQDKYYVIHYVHGGIAASYHSLLIDVNAKDQQILAHSWGKKKAGFAQFKEHVLSGEFDVNKNFWDF